MMIGNKYFCRILLVLSVGFGLLASAGVTERRPRPLYKTKIVKIESMSPKNRVVSVNVELADSPEKWEYGLMFERTLDENKGMLFIFLSEEPRTFWMKNTFIDLSIGYFDSQKKLVSILDMERMKSEMETNLPTYPSLRPAQYALEVPKGWFRKNNIKIGDKLVLP